MGRKCVGVTVCALLLLLVHSSQSSELTQGSSSSESSEVTSTEFVGGQTTNRYDSKPVVTLDTPAEDKPSPQVSGLDATQKQIDGLSTPSTTDRSARNDGSSPAQPLTTDHLVPQTGRDSRRPIADNPRPKDVYFVDGVSDKEPVAFVGAQLQHSSLSESATALGKQQQRSRQANELVLSANDARRPPQENETRVTENVENALNENRNSSGVEAERVQTQDAIWEQHNLKTTSSSIHRKQEPSLGANSRAGAETGAVAIPVMHFGGQRFIEFGVVRTQRGPQVLKNHILTQVVVPGGANDTKKITNLVRSVDPSGPPAQSLVPLMPTIEDDQTSAEKTDEAAATSPSESSVSDSSSSASQETSSSSSESSEVFSEDGAAGCRKDKSRRKRKVTKPKPVPASLASVFEFKRLSKKKPNSNSLLPKTLAETRATESSEDENFDSTPVTPDSGSYYPVSDEKLDVERRQNNLRAGDDFLQNVLRNFGVQVEVVPAANSTNSTTGENVTQNVGNTTPLPGPTVALLPIIPPVQTLSRTPETSDILHGPTNSLLKSKPPRVQIKVSEEELSAPAVKANSKNRSSAKAVAANSLGHGVSDEEKGFTSSTKSSRQGFEVPTIPPVGSPPSPIPKPPTETFTIDLNKIRENKRKANKPKGGSVELTPGKVYIHDLESATFEEAPDEDGTLARNFEARKKYEDDFVKNILQNYGVQLDSKTGNAKSEFISSESPLKSGVPTNVPAPPVAQQRNPLLLNIRPPSPREQIAQPPVFLHEPQKQQNSQGYPPTSSELPSFRNTALSGPAEILGPGEQGTPSSPPQQTPNPLGERGSQFFRSNEAIRIVPAPNLAGLQPQSAPQQQLYAPVAGPLAAHLQQPLTSATNQVKQEPRYEPLQVPAPQQQVLLEANQNGLGSSITNQQAPSQESNQQSPQAAPQSQEPSPQNLQENQAPSHQQLDHRSPNTEVQQVRAPQVQSPSTETNSQGFQHQVGTAQQGAGEPQASIPAQVPSGQEYFHPHIRIVQKPQLYQGQQLLLNNHIQLLQPQFVQSGDQAQLQQQQQLVEPQQPQQLQGPQQQQQLQGPQQQQQLLEPQQPQQLLEPQQPKQLQGPQQQQQLLEPQQPQQLLEPQQPQQLQGLQQPQLILEPQQPQQFPEPQRPEQQPVHQEPQQVLQAGDQGQSQQPQLIQVGDQIQLHHQHVVHGDGQVQHQIIQNHPTSVQPQLTQQQIPPEQHLQYLPRQQPVDPQLQGQPVSLTTGQQGQPLQLLSPADIPADQQLRISQPQYEPLPSSDTQNGGFSQLNHVGTQQQLPSTFETPSQADGAIQQQHHLQSHQHQSEIDSQQQQQHLLEQQREGDQQQHHLGLQLTQHQHEAQLQEQRGAHQPDSHGIQLQQQQEIQLQQQREVQLQQQEQEIQFQQQHQEIQLQQQHQEQTRLSQQQQQQQQQVQLPQQQISIREPHLSIQDQPRPPQQASQYQTPQLQLSQSHQIIPQPNLFRAAHNVAAFPSGQAITVPTFEVENGQLRRVPAYAGRTRQLRFGPGFVTRAQFRPLPLKTGTPTGSTQTTSLPFGGFQVTHFAPGSGATAHSTYRPDKNGLLSNVFSQSFNPVEGTSSTFRLSFGYRNRENSLLSPSYSNGKQFDSLFAQIPSSQRVPRVEFLNSQKKDLFSGSLFNNQRSYVLGSSGSLVSNVDMQSNGPNEYTGYIKKASRRKSR